MPISRPRRPGYVELHAHSDHSLLDGVPSPEALVIRAAELELPALALTDHDNLYGAVRFVRAAEDVGIKPILGAELSLEGGAHLTLLVENGEGYRNLCRLITLARRAGPKGRAELPRTALAAHTAGLIALSGCRRGDINQAMTAGKPQVALEHALGYRRLFGQHHFYIELQRHHQRGDARRVAQLVSLAQHVGLGVVATGNVHYLASAERELHDIFAALRHRLPLEEAQRQGLLRPNDEYYLRSAAEMRLLFPGLPAALENSVRIAERCAHGGQLLPAGPQTLPRFPVPGGRPPEIYLRALCLDRLRHYYPSAPPRGLLEKELAVINLLGLADYFLVVWDIVRFARRAGIRCQARGSAVNSLVAYLLGISSIDPVATGLVFERFLSVERATVPDIDLDLAADRREEVIQYVYGRYGEQHAAMACTLVTYRARSAVRDTARALGFPPALVERLSVALDVRRAESVQESRGLAESFGEDLAGKPFQHLLRIVPQLAGKPRHLGIHNGGMIVSGPPLVDLAPLEPATMPGRMVIQWDKYSLEDVGMAKIDLLGLRTLSAIETAVQIVDKTNAFELGTGGNRTAAKTDRLALERLTFDDPAVYDMICRGETIGVFQIESRAQASLIPRFQPRCFADLVVQISLIRPGPIQAGMVHPYLRRRRGEEPVSYLHPLLQAALEETLGVIVFQEQVLKVASDLAGFPPGRAELLRRALGHKQADAELAHFRQRFLDGAAEKGVSFQIARQVWRQLAAFGSYSFAKSHAAAFAVITYQAAWLRCYHPAAFFAGLMANQPLGFYPSHIIVSEARRQGVQILPADITHSELQTTVEAGALRLGLSAVAGLGEVGGANLIEARQAAGPFRTLADFYRRTGLDRRKIEALIWSGAFDSWGVSRKQLIWNLEAALAATANGYRPALPMLPADEPRFPFMSQLERLWSEFTQTGVSANGHLTELVSEQLRGMGVTPSAVLPDLTPGSHVWIGGVLAAAQRPPTAKGLAFLTIEDIWGLVNVVLYPEVYEASRPALRSRFVMVEGELQNHHGAINVLASRVVSVNIKQSG